MEHGVVRILMPTYRPGGLKARIYPHWCRSPTFTLVSLRDGYEVKVFERRKVTPLDLVKGEGVNVIIACSLSIKALEELSTLGVKVYSACDVTVEEAIGMYRGLRLPRVSVVKVLDEGA